MSIKTSDSKISLNCDFAHHAYCLVGDRQIVLEALHSELEGKLKFIVSGNPDYWFAEYDKLNMKDGTREVVRDEILSQALLRPIMGENRVMVICANSVNDNVQNALLKFFEEPIPCLKVFLVLPNDTHLLPTVRSRMIILNITEPEESGGVENEEENILDESRFLKGQIHARMKISTDIASALSDEEITRGDVVAFFRRLQKVAFEKYKKQSKRGLDSRLHGNDKEGSNIWLLELEKSCRYAEDPSSSFKVLLEYLAMIVPKI